MRNVILLLLILGYITSCNTRVNRKEMNICEDTLKAPDFIVDSVLKRQYLEDTLADAIMKRIPDSWDGKVFSAEIAFKIAEPILISGFGKDNITSQKPFSINLIDDEIWVIEGTLHQSEGEIVMGGTAYIEVRKSNGEILRVLHGE